MNWAGIFGQQPQIGSMTGGGGPMGQPSGGVGAFAGPYSRTLSPEDRSAANRQGLLATALALLQSSGPSAMPVSFGSAFGSAALRGLDASNQYSRGALEAEDYRYQRGERERVGAERAARDAAIGIFARNPTFGTENMTPDERAGIFRAVPEAMLGAFKRPELEGPSYGQPVAMQAPDGATQMVQTDKGGNMNVLPYGAVPRVAPTTTVTQNAGETGINYGTPPTGMAWVRDVAGKVQLDERGVPRALPIGGGPADKSAEEKAAAEREAAKAAGQAVEAGIVIGDIDRAVELIDRGNVAGWGALLSAVPGTDANAVKGMIDTIKSNISLNRLQKMRDESKRGVSLGNITEGELALLGTTLGSLEQSQDKQTLLYNLKRVRDVFDTVVNWGEAPAGVTPDEWARMPDADKKLFRP